MPACNASGGEEDISMDVFVVLNIKTAWIHGVYSTLRKAQSVKEKLTRDHGDRFDVIPRAVNEAK